MQNHVRVYHGVNGYAVMDMFGLLTQCRHLRIGSSQAVLRR